MPTAENGLLLHPSSCILHAGFQRLRSPVQHLDLEGAEGDLVPVVLQGDVAGLLEAIARHRLELALLDPVLPVGAPELVLDHLRPVQPVLDAWSVHEDTRRVPLSY